MAEKKSTHTFINILKDAFIVDLIPVVINLLLLLIWRKSSSSDSPFYSLFSILTLLTNAFAVPLFLVAANTLIAWDKGQKIFIGNILQMFISAECCIFLDYYGWGLSGGDMYNPDWLTYGFVITAAQCAAFIVIAGGIIAQVFLMVRQYKNKKSKTSGTV